MTRANGSLGRWPGGPLSTRYKRCTIERWGEMQPEVEDYECRVLFTRDSRHQLPAFFNSAGRPTFRSTSFWLSPDSVESNPTEG